MNLYGGNDYAEMVTEEIQSKKKVDKASERRKKEDFLFY